MKSIRLLIADDLEVVRAGLQGRLASQPDLKVVAEAADGVEAVELAAQIQPDVILMDLRMPHMNGVEAISRIRAEQPDAHILVLTTYDTDSDILPAVEAGATGYLLKDAPRADLFKAIRAAAQGEAVLTPSVAARLMGHMRPSTEETLSEREIAHKLHISEATVKSHLVHVFGKLGISDRTVVVTIGLERGIIRLDL